MAQEHTDTQGLNTFPDELWDAAQLEDGFRGVGPAPEHQSGLGHYYDAGALAAYSVAPEFYVPVPDASGEVAFNHYDADGAHPSSAFGFLHYLPPAAISKKYYALQDPNVYPTDGPSTSSYASPPAAFDAEPSPTTTDAYYGGTQAMTSSPTPKVEPSEEHPPPSASFTPTPGPPSPLTTESSYDVLATPTPTPTPLASPAYYQDFRFQPAQGWHPVPSGPLECACPVLPKQRRNRDDPGGDAGQLAQVCANSPCEFEDQTGTGTPYYRDVAPGAAHGSQYAYHGPGAMSAQEQPAPVVVPSQWKVGAALDRLRFPQYGGDWDALMTTLYGEGYQAYMPRSNSPLNAEDMAQLEQLSLGFGLGLGLSSSVSASAQPTTPMTPITPATPGSAVPRNDDDDDDTKLVVYSPVTGRRIPVTAGPNGPVLQLSAVPPSARRPYKRGAVAACAFCRRRKIACGGPKEGDEAGRCGQCIQRQQRCEFPGSSYQHAQPVPLSAPPYGYAHAAYGVGGAPH
ncbi:transcription factor [Ganoderma sinense ZZ0214-1]|uniref:Transcription factor n=1 Tax=Ganoderma sinense ZZ0214-1 TaxID=1077348 RepID=A0A2G8S7C5_9APHY|nr:transcription factor [Ganoderma sinense ZZ0214-1]